MSAKKKIAAKQNEDFYKASKAVDLIERVCKCAAYGKGKQKTVFLLTPDGGMSLNISDAIDELFEFATGLVAKDWIKRSGQ